jgi:beta-phosphoglucomutase-like phosphatase (HAD superfamily)
MRIAVDLDNTLVDELGQRIRPGIPDLLRRLRSEGHDLVLWTSSTRQRALRILQEHGLRSEFSELCCREDYDPANAGALKDLRLLSADALIDDDPKQVAFASSLGKIGILVTSYRGGNCSADDLAHVMKALKPRRWPWRR